jgi:hypothetical protein
MAMPGVRHLGEQVGFEDLAFVRGQDARQFGHFGREGPSQFGDGAPAALVDDVDDHAVLDHAGGGGVAAAGEGVLGGRVGVSTLRHHRV